MNHEETQTETRWIPVATDQNGLTQTFKCSACGGFAYVQHENNVCYYEYCPNCGQRMEHGQ